MATQVFQHSDYGGGLVRVEIDVNDANWRIQRVRCINNSAYSLVARILNAGVQAWTATAPPNATTEWAASAAQLGWDGGLIMGPYVVQTRWPA